MSTPPADALLDIIEHLRSHVLPRFFFIERFYNCTLERQRINPIDLLLDNLSVWSKQEGVWHLALPAWINRIDQFLPASGRKNEVFERCLFLFQECQHLLLLLGAVHRDCHDLKIPVPVHAVYRDKLMKLRDTRRTPRRPEVDQAELSGFVLPQRFHGISIGRRECNWLGGQP